MEAITDTIQQICQELFDVQVEPVLSRPDEQFGDYATNIALQLAGRLGQNPRDVADAICQKLHDTENIAQVAVAGPGFINLSLTDDFLLRQLQAPLAQPYKGQVVVAEYSDPNPFKILHAGHLYTSIVGDAIANLFAAAGATVHRVNFGGDVGLHVGKTMWAILQELGGELPDKLASIAPEQRSEWLAGCYVAGTAAYEDDPAAKAEIVALNKQVYRIQSEQDHQSALAHIYWTTRTWSYEYFDAFYERIGTKFEKYYPESETAGLGLETVRQHLGDVFKESDGAVVFDGEAHGLHTRVFINSEGLPTYEAKDVGLIMKKWQDYHFDRSLVITGNEQEQYMAVVLKAIEQFEPKLAQTTTHLTHGIVKLQGGVKMSSRKGNILRAVDVLDAATEANQEATGNTDQRVVLGAVKYAFLKQRVGGDIIYDPKESVSLVGNSGPYLQYAFVRANSILRKAGDSELVLPDELQPGERTLVRKLSEYNEVVAKAVQEHLPSYICTYLYELAQTFNRFYEHNQVIGDARQAMRLQLVHCYAHTLKDGLELLSIPVPEHM